MAGGLDSEDDFGLPIADCRLEGDASRRTQNLKSEIAMGSEIKTKLTIDVSDRDRALRILDAVKLACEQAGREAAEAKRLNRETRQRREKGTGTI